MLVNDYCKAALDYLSHAYDSRHALFSFLRSEGRRGEIITISRRRFAALHDQHLSGAERGERMAATSLGSGRRRPPGAVPLRSTSTRSTTQATMVSCWCCSPRPIRSHPAVGARCAGSSVLPLAQTSRCASQHARPGLDALGRHLVGDAAGGRALAARIFALIRTRFAQSGTRECPGTASGGTERTRSHSEASSTSCARCTSMTRPSTA